MSEYAHLGLYAADNKQIIRAKTLLKVAECFLKIVHLYTHCLLVFELLLWLSVIEAAGSMMKQALT